ncbi:MAG: hypothetical protein SFT90_00990 [Rickettsiales bacterium]|nr:hypothetical protein [Rickettsiales bacterium]
MEDKEFLKWQEVRKQGKQKYAIKTSLICYFAVFTLYFLVNGYNHYEKLDKYLAYNLGNWKSLLLTAFITITFLYFSCIFFWRFNEKRYNETEKNKNS